MKILTIVSAIVAVVAVFAASHMPTSAHAGKVNHGNDFATVSPDHRTGNVCDEEVDGHAVWAI